MTRVIRGRLPYPVTCDGVPDNIEILAMAPASFAKDEIDGPGFRYYVSDSACAGVVGIVAEDEAEARDIYRHGAGMVVAMPKGRGHVFTAGSCEWVMGLTRDDPFTQTITRTVLRRFTH